VDRVRPETGLHEVAALLLREGRRAAPVVNAQNRVVGIITNGDLVERGGLPLRLELLGGLGDPGRPEVAAHLTGLHGEGRTAGTIMTPRVVTAGPAVPVAQAAKLMLDRRLKRLPVVDAEGHLLGMLSRTDVLKTATAGYPLAGEPPGTQPEQGHASAGRARGAGPVQAVGPVGPLRRVADVMNPEVPTVRPDTPLPEVLDAVVSTRLNRVVVVDGDRRPVGIVVDTDLMQRVTPAAHPGLIQALMRRALPGSPEQREAWHRLTGHTAKDLMRPREEMLVVPEDADIADVIDQSLEQRIKLVAVVDVDGKLAGMAGRADLLAALAPAA
jgi:CBS domain-containing protein